MWKNGVGNWFWKNGFDGSYKELRLIIDLNNNVIGMCD